MTNPYESPNFVHSEKRQRSSATSFAIAGTLALVGFGIAVASQLYFNQYLDDSYGPLVLGTVLAASEFVAARRPARLNFARRLLISTLLFLPAGFVSGLINAALGWQQRGYDDPHRAQRFCCFLVVYLAAILGVRAWFASYFKQNRK